MQMRKWTRAIGLAGILLSLSPMLYAAKCDCPKLAYIDSERIYSETKRAQEISSTLQKEFAARRSALEKMEQSVLQLQEQLKKTQGFSAQKKLEKEAETAKLQFVRERQQFAEDYSLRRNELFAALQKEANQAIVVVRSGGR